MAELHLGAGIPVWGEVPRRTDRIPVPTRQHLAGAITARQTPIGRAGRYPFSDHPATSGGGESRGRHHRDAVLHFVLAGRGDRVERSGQLRLLRGRHRRTGHRQSCAVVHPVDHAVLLRRARHLHRELLDVRARRRVQSGARSDGRHARQILGLGADVRLRADRPHQRGQRGPVPRRPDQRSRHRGWGCPTCT